MKEKIIDFWESEKIRCFVKENKEILVKVATAALLVVAAFFVFIITGDEDESLAKDDQAVIEAEPQSAMIMVDIGGEVITPMVVELEEGSRVEDAIIAAGGITENADLTDINRAAFLEDGDKILIPAKIDEESPQNIYDQYGTSKGNIYSDGKININTADSEQLQTLDGIGPVTAEKIIEHRETYGRFKNIEDLKDVSGIGDKMFDKLKNDIRT